MPALTSFVGRDDEVAEVAGLLGEYRLVTVTGPGGMGKTRLAGEVTRAVAPRFADGAWLVELAAVRDPGQVAAAVAAKLGVPKDPGRSITEALVTVLGRQQVLLVLDNCQHMLAAVAGLCRALLPAADDVRVLATSREPIGLAGEARFRLPPLPVLPPDDLAGQPVPAAVRLFADRARQADPRFVLNQESGPLAARLAGRLDGMPLAIELAAARVEALGLAQLVDRLEGSLQLLTSPDRTAADRHQSLAATVDWSYRLLGPQEQQVFRRLAVFPGPFTLDAAVMVAGAGAEAAVLRTRDEIAGMRWIDAEDATIAQALAWALAQDPGAALRLAVAVAEWWIYRDRAETGRALLLAATEHAEPGGEEWCVAQFWLGDIGPPAESVRHETAACEVLTARGPSPLLAEVLAGRSRTLLYLGRLPEAVSDARGALEISRQIGYPAGEVLALAQLSRTALYADDTAGALDWARQAQRVLASGELGWTLRFTGHFVIEVLIESGDLTAARRGLADSLAWMREAADRPHQATTLALLADLELRAGNITESGRLLHEATELAVRSGADDRLLKCLDVCGYLCAARGQPSEAVTIWTAFRARLEADGSPDMPLNAQRRQEPLARAVQALGSARSQAARERGAAMTLATAAEFVLMAAGADGQAGPMTDRPPGLAQLSAREQELVGLVANGCTDAEIAGQLYIAVSTVRSHLDRIRDKTSCRRRADLTRLALQAGLA